MAQRPNRYPSFAIEAAPADLVEIPAPVAAAGFATAARPPAQWFNYFFNLLGGWINFLRAASPTNWTRRTSAGPAGWDTVVGTTDNVRVHVAIDTATSEREVAPYRYVLVGAASGGGALQVWVSRRGVGWSDQSAQLPMGYIDDPPRGVGQFGGRWVFWTHGQIFSTVRDTAAGLSALDPTGPDWILATNPAALNTLLSLAYDPDTATFAIGYDTAASRAWAWSLDGAQTFTVAGVTGAPTGSPRALVWSGSYFVSVTTTGQVWRATGSGANFALATTLPVSDFWHLASDGDGTVVAYEVLQTTTRIRVSTDDGATWSALTVPATVRKLSRLIYADGAWVASATDAPYVWTTNDLVTWVRGVLPHPETADAIYDLAYGDGGLFAVGDSVSYQSHRAADAGPGPADGLATPLVLSDEAYLQGTPISTTDPTIEGQWLVYDGDEYAPNRAGIDRVTTVGAVTDTLATIALPPKCAAGLHATISAVTSTGGNALSIQFGFGIQTDASNSTLIDTADPLKSDGVIGSATFAFNFTGLTCEVEVTGEALKTIYWTIQWELRGVAQYP